MRIQMPGQSSTYLENDTSLLDAASIVADGYALDPNPFYGRVAYAYGHAIDQPLSIVRINYESRRDSLDAPVSHWTLPAFAVFPLWNSRGQADLGHYANGREMYCVPTQRCGGLAWPGTWFDLARPNVMRRGWHGTLLEDKEDAAFTLYRRNRSYDARTGQFTQEDPIGLAGGLNAYGFADGDPINYSDPYGLAAEETAQCKGRLSCAMRALRAAGSVYRAYRTTRAVNRVLRGTRETSRSSRLVQYEGTGGMRAAREAFDALPRRGDVNIRQTPRGEVRDIVLPDGGTASVRPFSSGDNMPTVQINMANQTPIKIRFPEGGP